MNEKYIKRQLFKLNCMLICVQLEIVCFFAIPVFAFYIMTHSVPLLVGEEPFPTRIQGFEILQGFTVPLTWVMTPLVILQVILLVRLVDWQGRLRAKVLEKIDQEEKKLGRLEYEKTGASKETLIAMKRWYRKEFL